VKNVNQENRVFFAAIVRQTVFRLAESAIFTITGIAGAEEIEE